MNGGAQEGMSILKQEIKSSEKIFKHFKNETKFSYCRDVSLI